MSTDNPGYTLMKVSDYSRLMGVHRTTVLQWVYEGKVEYTQPSKLIFIKHYHDASSAKKWVGYARVSGNGQQTSLDNQELAILKHSAAHSLHIPDGVVKEVGSGFNENRKKLTKLLSDPEINIIVEHRDRLSRSNFKLIQAALKAQGREILVLNPTEQEQDFVAELSEFLVSKCASIYGKRGAKRKAEKAVELVVNDARTK